MSAGSGRCCWDLRGGTLIRTHSQGVLYPASSGLRRQSAPAELTRLDTPSMLRNMPAAPRLRSSLSVLLCLVVIVATGLPVPSGADHDAQTCHIEVGHGGHGTVLVARDDRLQSRVSVQFVAITIAVPDCTEPLALRETTASAESVVPLSRDPPLAQPRAPPFTTS